MCGPGAKPSCGERVRECEMESSKWEKRSLPSRRSALPVRCAPRLSGALIVAL